MAAHHEVPHAMACRMLAPCAACGVGACLGLHAAQSDARASREACMLNVSLTRVSLTRVSFTHTTGVGHRPRARQHQATARGHFNAKPACQILS